MFKALLVKKKLKKKVMRTLMENNRLRLVNLTSMLSLLSTSIITLFMMIIVIMENLIRLVTVMLPADGFGSSSLVATFVQNKRYRLNAKSTSNPIKKRIIIKSAQNMATSETTMVNAVMAAVEMKSAPALTVASVPVDPM